VFLSSYLLSEGLRPSDSLPDTRSRAHSQFQEDPPPVHHPYRNEANRGEADRIGKRGPPWVRNVREHVIEHKADHVGSFAAGVKVYCAHHAAQQLYDNVAGNHIRAEDHPYPGPATPPSLPLHRPERE